MGFGKKMEWSPVPNVIHWEIIGREKSGKTTLVAKLAKSGIGVVIDSDGRFADSVPKDSQTEFYPLSDKQSDMLDVSQIVKILEREMPKQQDDVSIIVVDTLTKILEPIITKIQEKGSTNLFSYKEKAQAMKQLRHALTKWNCETAWLYHKKQVYQENESAKGWDDKYKLVEQDFLKEVEKSRLGADITVSLEVIVDNSGKRGVKVVEARKGRVGIEVWDDTGDWTDFRKKLEDAIWGGLTQEDSEQLSLRNVDVNTWDVPAQAQRWAWKLTVEENADIFDDAAHVKNSYEKLRTHLIEIHGKDLTKSLMFTTWKEKVLNKLEK